jgi:hypothetical protein
MGFMGSDIEWRSDFGPMMPWRNGIRASVVMTAGVLLLGACTADSGNGGTTSGPRTPKPVSVQEYGTALANALQPLGSALQDLNKAKAYKGLGARVTAVEKAAAQAATTLGQVTPPPEVAAEHPRLVSALQQFDGELRGLGTDISERDLCTGSVVRDKLGQSDGTAALRTAMTPLPAKLPGVALTLTLPDANTKSASRPANGHFVRSNSRAGRGTLSINNDGGSEDAVVTLAKGGKAAVSVYVREAKKYTVTGVNDGKYTTFFTSGTDWDPQAKAFGRHCTFQRFDDPMSFHTIRTATQIRWRTWKITLHKVVGGNASTSDVDPDEFPTD